MVTKTNLFDFAGCLSCKMIDDKILSATEDAWKQKLLIGAERARQWEIDHWTTLESLKSMSTEEYLDARFFSPTDKKGTQYLRNMILSEMQSVKTISGSSFEKAIMDIVEEEGVSMCGQVHIDKDGNICSKKSVHRIDGYISAENSPTSIRNCYAISKKTTLRERWNQDIWQVSLCKKLLFLTRETPNESTVNSIREHGAIVVYPHATVTDCTWSFAEFVRQMKLFQNGGTDSSC